MSVKLSRIAKKVPLPVRAVRALAGVFGAHPWFDPAGIAALKHAYFPASRLWAAAGEAGCDPQRFYNAVPMTGRLEDRDKLAHALASYEEARAAVNAIEGEWQRDFFGPVSTPVEYRAAVEGARLRLRHDYNATRRAFAPLIRRSPSRARFSPPSVPFAESLYGSARAEPSVLTRVPDPMPPVEVSRSFPAAASLDYWLRFRSPSPRLADDVYARVHEPFDVIDPPTVILGHGICVEYDHWRGIVDEAPTLVAAGFRVIRPEAPWHGRRVPLGFFGGERIISGFPLSLVDAVTGAVREWAVLADWARETSRGPLAFAGQSLGALTAQLAASAAHDWPERLRPDALFLVTPGADLAEATASGVLASIFPGLSAVESAGWTAELLKQYTSLIEPKRRPVMGPQRIVAVIGRRDSVLPVSGAQKLIEDWCVPEDNLFLMDRGHFSVPLSLIRDPRPLARFVSILKSCPAVTSTLNPRSDD